MEFLPALIVAHIVGDFLLQNDWMQAKSRSSFACLIHVLAYSIPFWAVCALGFPALAALAILVQHFIQDRFSLHLRWMRLIGQTPPDRWPPGPLFVDQAWHIASIAAISLLA